MPAANKISILPTAIFRIPKFPINARLEDKWPELKKAIEESSPAFYEVIKELEYEVLRAQPEKVRHTIAKYFNRAKFRPVPYGHFASVGTVGLAPKSGPVVLDEQTIIHSFPDWTSVHELEYEFCEIAASNARIMANSTWYPAGGNLRYISQKQDGAYELVELGTSPLLLRILKKCRQPVNYKLLLKELTQDSTDAASLTALLEEMIATRFLITELDSNIIGPDYFQRRGYPDRKQDVKRYIICEREPVSGHLDARLLKHLPELVPLLQQLRPPSTISLLEEFKNRFLEKFDQREIPLMVALDPELGIGYGNTIQSIQGDELIARIVSSSRRKEQPSEEEFKNLFLHQLALPSQIIQLENLNPAANKETKPLPNTISAIITQNGDDIILEHIGGVTANSLVGRFTRIGGRLYQHSKEITALEQGANSEVLFFDIGYTSELSVDNVNRRNSIYPLQLNIINYDTTDAPLTAGEILVSVRNNSIVLRSESRNKRLVPRHSSAYNYSRSDLALFRFLCDLSHQDLQTNLKPDIRAICPGLRYYPRIQYKNIVVSPASLFIEAKDFQTKTQLSAYIAERSTARHLKFGATDQKLVIDAMDADDMDILFRELKKAGTLWLEEAFITAADALQDQAGNRFFSQFLLTLFHKQNIYRPLTGAHIDTGTKRSFYPGGQWLFFQVYTHPSRADYLLSEYIEPYLDQNRALIDKWFFIRYNEGGDHIRLRLQVKHGVFSVDLIGGFYKALQPELKAGFISDMQIRTYERELERYGPQYIEQIESHFFKDSSYVFTLLQYAQTEDQKYSLCIDLMRDIQSAGVLEDDHYLTLVKSMYESFRAEFNVNAETTKKIAGRYESLLGSPSVPLSPGTAKKLEQFRDSFVEALFQRQIPARKQLLVDLFHMHINRLFSENQRAHEMLIYYFLIRDWYRSWQAKNLQQSKSQGEI